MSRFQGRLVALGVIAATGLLSGEALAKKPASKPAASTEKPQKAPTPPKNDPKQGRALVENAKAHLKAKRLAEAAELTRRCVEVAPEYADCHLMRGTVLAQQGDADMGARHYRRFLELAPDEPKAPAIRELLRQYDEKHPGKKAASEAK